MNLLDITIICFLVISVIRGAVKGFLREFISLINVIISICFANYYQPQATRYLSFFLPGIKSLPLFSFFLLFFFSLTVCSIIAWAIRSLFTEGGPSGKISRILGSFVGLVKSLIIVYLVIILTFSFFSKTPIIAESKLVPIIVKTYQKIIIPVSPSFKRFKKRIFSDMERLKKEILR